MAICTNHSPLLHFFMIIVSFSVIKIPLSSALYFNYSSFEFDDGITYKGAFPDKNRVIQLPATDWRVGRVTYDKPMRLWDKTTGNLTDFTTHFSFAIDSEGRSHYADGMAFFLAPNGSKIPTDRGGGSLGLTAYDEFVAVEFDIFQNDWDPPGVHVGIDINSVKSVKNETWLNNITDGRRSEACISYNSRTYNLSVVFTGFRENTTVMQYLDYQVDLSQFLREEWVTFGFSMSTGSFMAKYSIYSWQFNCTLEVDDPTSPSPNPSSDPSRRRRRNKTLLAVGLSLIGGVLVGALSLIFWIGGFCRKRKNEDDGKDNLGINEYIIDDDFERGAGPRKFSYNELTRATNDFNDEQKLGQGGFGGVYKGFLRETNSYIAVKKVSKGSKQGIKEYASEVKIISRLRHRNLVQLLGWCHEKNQLLLVYELMPNGSLDSHLFKENSLLTWEFRYKIALDLASGLLYLQEEWEQCVVHRDIKSSNIMLDSNFNAKIGDFGLARLVEHSKGSQTTVLAGTVGYMAPECATTGKASKESDIYSFGIVALEIACGRKPIQPGAEEVEVRLVNWVWELYGCGNLLEAADPRLFGNFDEQQLQCLMMIGLWCAHPNENLRPSMKQAIQVLNFEAPWPILPPKMPVPTNFYPPVNMVGIDGIISAGSQTQSSSSY